MTASVHRLRRPAPEQGAWSDEAVAHACASRDPVAMSELYDRFRLPVTRYLSRAIGAKQEVEDLVQATFLEIARGKARFDGRSVVSTWLFGIATNVARHHLRASARRMRLLSAVKDSLAGADAGGPVEVADARQRLHRAQRVLMDQPVERRLAFVLCELEGVAARDAASILETTETAIWKRVSDVRRALRVLTGERDT